MSQALARGYRLACQTRSAERLSDVAHVARIVEGEPADETVLDRLVEGCDAAVFALGVGSAGPTTLFSDTTRALLRVMDRRSVLRLVAVTGVGAGDSRGHGGLLYNNFVFPLFARHRYHDKNLQEDLIRKSRLDWTILRPASFVRRPPGSALEVIVNIAPDTQLRSIARSEVAEFALACLEDPESVGRTYFIGHR